MNGPLPRRIQLEAAAPDGARRFVSTLGITLAEGQSQSWVTVTRTGRFSDPRYGWFEITKPMLLSMISNFEKNTYGQEIFFDRAHHPEDGSAAKIIKLAIDGNRLRALVEWTPFGRDLVRNKGYRYLSADYHENFEDNEKGLKHGALLLGAGLTIRPVIKHLDPIDEKQLSEAFGGENVPTLLNPALLDEFHKETQMPWSELIKKLSEKLKAMKLSEANITTLVDGCTKALAAVTDEAAAKSLCETIEAAGKQLAEAGQGNNPISITLSAPSGQSGLSAADVQKLLSEHATAQAAAAQKDADDLAAKQKLLSDTINASKLPDQLKKELADAVMDLVTVKMSDDQIKKLGEVQIASGNRMEGARQLSSLGYSPIGSTRIVLPDEGARKLSGMYHDHLKLTSAAALGQIRLLADDKVHPFVAKVLSEFDRINGAEIDHEVKQLAGEVSTANTNLPVGFRREVIREALSDLRVLELITADIDPAATLTTQIPYELRDVSAVVNDGIVYEGQPIPNGGIQQLMDSAYINPMKIAMLLSNEVIHFSRASGLNWDAMARNIESNARFLKELLVRRICNEMQRGADAYNAVAVTAESISSQLDGSTKNTIKTANFPIVRNFQQKDVKGNNVGSAENAITVVLNSVTINQWDGTGSQSAGTYWRVTNYNLGYVQFVNQAGTPVTPPATGTNTISYSRATNVIKVDLDVPNGSTTEKQMNKVIQGIGARKAMLQTDRFVTPDFMLMSPTLNDAATNAEQFTAQGKRNGADTSSEGDLQTIKSIPAFSTNAPGIDLGSERILMGQRGALGYVVAKPFQVGDVFEARHPNGQPTGQKQAYGEEYNAIKLPTPIRNRFTSVLVYSFTGR